MNRLSLKFKIHAGFVLIAILLLFIGLVSYLGQSRLNEQLKSVQAVDEVLTNVLEVDSDVQQLRHQVDRFVSSGHASLPAEVGRIQQRISNRIDKAQSSNIDPEMNSLFGQIKAHLEEYSVQFNSVITERKLREELLQKQLPDQLLVVEKLLVELNDSLSNPDPSSDSIRLSLTQCQTAVSHSERALLRYFESPDSRFVKDSVAQLEIAIDHVKETVLPEADRERLILELREFGRLGLRAVQATRSYLYFRNVVMAGEQSEVAYYAAKLREHGSRQDEQLTTRVESIRQRVTWLTMATIIGTIFCSLLIAARLNFLTIPPIAALTNTFDQLSRGESLSEIPGTERVDEIGKMANAARVFSDQNQQTRELLEQSKTLTDQLKQKATELESTNDQLDSFAYVASHDLKSPLRGIRQLAGWIEEDVADDLPKKSALHLGQLQSRVSKMEILLQDLLDFSRVGRFETEPELVDVGELVRGIIQITDNPDSVKVDWQGTVAKITTLRSPLEQVLFNLVGNAIKHNDKGSDGLVEISCFEMGDEFRFVIKDNGPGIDPVNHERAFQMYQRVGDIDVEGSGMGLAIVRKQVQQMGGEITLMSQLGSGATFEFSWPVGLSAMQKELVDG